MRRFSSFGIGFWVAVCVATLATGQQCCANKPDLAKWIDQRFERHYAEQQQAITTVDDATFLRRVYLDLAGRIPTVAELRDFTDDRNPDKRLEALDQLLGDKRFSIHTARVWRRVLMPPTTTTDTRLASSLDNWLETQLNEGAGYDELARRLVTAGGADTENVEAVAKEIESLPDAQRFNPMLTTSPTAFLQHTGAQPAGMASAVTRVFLGVRLECAQCHDHPFTDWKQEDFWGVAAFFAGAQLNPRVNRAQPDGVTEMQAPKDTRTTQISDEDGNTYQLSLPWDDVNAALTIPEEELPRRYFARWMTSPDNPHFAATAVNRVWQQLCGQGLIDAVDDLDQATQADRQVVLDDLAEKFAASGFKMKALMRAICASDFYQRTSERQESAADVRPRPLKVMTPEQLFDSYEVAVALPISSMDRGPRFNGERDALVSRMEEAMGERPDDFRNGIPQALTLMNGKTTAEATDLQKSRTLRAVIDAPFLDLNEKIETLFLATLSRSPHESERAKLLTYIQDRPSDQEKAEAFSEVMWALINSPEFVLVR